MNISLQIQDFGKLTALMNALGPSNRQRLNAVGAKALEVKVRAHVARISASRHGSAGRLGASPTGHYRKGMRGIAGHATASGGEVVIPIAGISSAYHDITITPKIRKSLTIPISKHSYGKTAWELQKRGWKFYVRKSKKEGGIGGDGILYGKRNGETVPLFKMTKKVVLKRDKDLLPSREQCASIVAQAMTSEVNRRIANAR